ncbi:MAG: type II toxin-antitoxin system HicB family antitoxin [Bacteroidetes bacterium]|nr:MAG: type II toxin-antitoxin system HicB family antitoxin [Bacteroidota bacterium]
MLTSYIQAAMHRAHYEIMEEDGAYYGRIPGFDGVWAKEKTLEECREELQSALEDWLLLGLRLGHTLPEINGITLNIEQEVN